MVWKNTGAYRPDKNDPSKSDSGAAKDDSSEARIRTALENDRIDSKYGFERVRDSLERTGYLINMHTTEILDEDKKLVAAMDYYFIQMNGTRFKISLAFQPYFLIQARKQCEQEVIHFLSKKYAGAIAKIETLQKEDLDLANHLAGLQQTYIKLSFVSQSNLMKVRKELLTAANKNREKEKKDTIYAELLANTLTSAAALEHAKKTTDHMENILDIREHDVPYHIRVSIDMQIFCGSWYTIKSRGNNSDPPKFTKRDDILERPDPIVFAYDIETTKLPLKFPDSQTDQIMMISYMIDGQGYLITNREIIASDVEDFEYTPKPEFEGLFIVFNEPNELALLQKFFDHILDVKPHIFVTYNGDFFDWPFVEARATANGCDMKQEIGFSRLNADGAYFCRPAMHMDCLCWVKRDSYLPVGSQGLKAVAKAKLRYDPVELDPEDMCRMAMEQPQVLSNYSVSDAVATYYLYMKYVHPFIFALCTIIPMEPDEVLRKGSGTLCETLLMVQAFHANIVFPNKQIEQLNKLTADGHVLDQETYVGGHVEALESGVFRADIPCRFRLIPSAFEQLMDGVTKTMTHAIEVEEGVPLELVTNFDEVCEDIRGKLCALKDHPNRLENPVIYHLDVGAMYPNIILTNRLQPSAMVNSRSCAVCDHNRPGATCQRHMEWTWRGEFLPATRNEYQRIQQQLECQKFPPLFPGGPQRAFHTLPKEDRAAFEKKRLSDYCRVAYKKTKVTRIETRTTTVCQKENSFYVDTVRAFRDRRYEYKALNKKAKQLVVDAVKSGDAAEVKSAKSREVLYDSLQLAHKCILNSFYGYVMRRGARWYSMDMAGIVCYTGANIIMRAREIIEQVGRPLELDTDGIWCVLPASFPETFTVTTNHEKKKKFNISYPNAILNAMVKDYFTNDQYHELVNPGTREYLQKAENSIFFEVDGPYLGMVLPASKEEGKKLKKRYAVFNFDGTLAELKGFEVKRRGELQLIKIFQSSVFEAFLKGDTLETCYAAVARVADYWLDVLYSKGSNMPDSELFELISENRSMSKKLEDYGGQKSTSISTAKRLAEFLGDKMVKDAGLACKFIISRKPEGAPVTERAIPLAIFQSNAAVKRHHLRRWLKDNSIDDTIDIRDVLDWAYYIERLSGAIQKIITIPAAMQGLTNPVPRVKHPEWLHKKMLEKTDILKQRRINEMFTSKPRDSHTENVDSDDDDDVDDNGESRKETMHGAEDSPDIEDIGQPSTSKPPQFIRPIVTKIKRKRQDSDSERERLKLHWREALGAPPLRGKTKEERQAWMQFQKKKWEFQRMQQKQKHSNSWKRSKTGDETPMPIAPARSTAPVNSLGSFLRRTQRTLLDSPWQIVQVSEMVEPGLFKLWVLIGSELHQVKVTVPRIFYVNQRIAKAEDHGETWKKCNRILPRGRPMLNLYQYSVPEKLYKEHQEILMGELSAPEIEGIYETQMNLEFRVLTQLGCVCMVDRQEYKSLVSRGMGNVESFNLNQLHSVKLSDQPYLENVKGVPPLKHIFLYQHNAASSSRGMYALFLGPSKQAHVYVLDTVRTDQMPNMNNLYITELQMKAESTEEHLLPPKDVTFTVHIEKEAKAVFRLIQLALREYREENRGPTILVLQVTNPLSTVLSNMPGMLEFPTMKIHVQDVESLYNALDWQRVGSRALIRHYLDLETNIDVMLEQCRYLRLPLCNAPSDPGLFGTDLCYARYLMRNNFILWCSDLERPDLGGRETDDNRLISDADDTVSSIHNSPGAYSTTCVELHTDALAVCALLQSQNILLAEGTSSATYFGAGQVSKIIDAVTGGTKVPTIDEGSASSAALRVLKGLLTTWLKDLLREKNLYANFQMTHFYRWLKTPTSLLYDPALTRTLQSLMRKLFLQLVAEFRRLGSAIVFANFSKIILNTKKNTIMDAIGYVEFVVQSIRNRELFHGIDLSYKHCWSYLLWLDEANHAGIMGKLPKGLTEAGESQDSLQFEEESSSSEDADIQMKWNMAEYLPQGVKTYFSAVVAGFIGTAYTEREKLAEMLVGEMLQKLFSITEKIQMRHPKIVPSENLLGELPGIRIDEELDEDVTPALQFVNAICQVLDLDATLTDQVLIVRRSLLRLVGVGEFNPIAKWKDPCSSFVLSEMICRICNLCKDLDLCRDKDVTIGPDGVPLCLCSCGATYNNSEIEWRLIEALNKKTLAYNLQDLICLRCREVKRENMSAVCTCAGDFALMIPRKNLIGRLKTFKAIAKYFKMELLLEIVEFNLQNS